MFAEERQHHILTEITQRGRVEGTDLAKRLRVSEDTIRRDLRTLSARGYLHKTHGGAVALDLARMPWSTRADLQKTAKRAVGAAAAPLPRQDKRSCSTRVPPYSSAPGVCALGH